MTPVSAFFPELAGDADKAKITLLHLLTMSAGFSWTEFGGQNSFPRMTKSPHWVNFVLDQPLSDTPGSRMVYNSGGSQLLAAILARIAGMSVAAYAERYLLVRSASKTTYGIVIRRAYTLAVSGCRCARATY